MSKIKGIFRTLKTENDELDAGDALLDAYGRGIATARDVIVKEDFVDEFGADELDNMNFNRADDSLKQFKELCIAKYKSDRGPTAVPYLAARLGIEQDAVGPWLKEKCYDAFITGVRAVWLKAVLSD